MSRSAVLDRFVDPQGDPEFFQRGREGEITLRDLLDRIAVLERYRNQPELTLTQYSIGPWFRENIGDVGDAEYTMRVAIPSAASTFASNAATARVSRPCRIVGGHLISNTNRTAGTATLAVNITYTDGSNQTFTLPDCELNATELDSAHTIVSHDYGVSVPANSLLRPRVVAASWGPTTADMTAWIVLSFADV